MYPSKTTQHIIIEAQKMVPPRPPRKRQCNMHVPNIFCGIGSWLIRSID